MTKIGNQSGSITNNFYLNQSTPLGNTDLQSLINNAAQMQAMDTLRQLAMQSSNYSSNSSGLMLTQGGGAGSSLPSPTDSLSALTNALAQADIQALLQKAGSFTNTGTVQLNGQTYSLPALSSRMNSMQTQLQAEEAKVTQLLNSPNVTSAQLAQVNSEVATLTAQAGITGTTTASAAVTPSTTTTVNAGGTTTVNNGGGGAKSGTATGPGPTTGSVASTGSPLGSQPLSNDPTSDPLGMSATEKQYYQSLAEEDPEKAKLFALQTKMQKLNELITFLTQMQSIRHDNAKAILQNLRA